MIIVILIDNYFLSINLLMNIEKEWSSKAITYYFMEEF